MGVLFLVKRNAMGATAEELSKSIGLAECIETLLAASKKTAGTATTYSIAYTAIHKNWLNPICSLSLLTAEGCVHCPMIKNVDKDEKQQVI